MGAALGAAGFLAATLLAGRGEAADRSAVAVGAAEEAAGGAEEGAGGAEGGGGDEDGGALDPVAGTVAGAGGEEGIGGLVVVAVLVDTVTAPGFSAEGAAGLLSGLRMTNQ